jgi:hypothetical protein
MAVGHIPLEEGPDSAPFDVVDLEYNLRGNRQVVADGGEGIERIVARARPDPSLL